MSVEANKALVQRYIKEAWNKGNVDVLDELYGANFNSGGYGDGGVGGLQAAITSYRTSFPDLHFTVEEVIAEEDKVAYRWTSRGTHHGEYDGIAPTGKPMTVTGITILRIVDGKITEDRSETNISSLREQLEQP
jgi:steroid delta-isomerase-like uncharacterized protein